MLGEYGQKIPESPYLIEPMIDSFAEEVSQATRRTATLTLTSTPNPNPDPNPHTQTLTLALALAR